MISRQALKVVGLMLFISELEDESLSFVKHSKASCDDFYDVHQKEYSRYASHIA